MARLVTGTAGSGLCAVQQAQRVDYGTPWRIPSNRLRFFETAGAPGVGKPVLRSRIARPYLAECRPKCGLTASLACLRLPRNRRPPGRRCRPAPDHSVSRRPDRRFPNDTAPRFRRPGDEATKHGRSDHDHRHPPWRGHARPPPVVVAACGPSRRRLGRVGRRDAGYAEPSCRSLPFAAGRDHGDLARPGRRAVGRPCRRSAIPGQGLGTGRAGGDGPRLHDPAVGRRHSQTASSCRPTRWAARPAGVPVRRP